MLADAYVSLESVIFLLRRLEGCVYNSTLYCWTDKSTIVRPSVSEPCSADLQFEKRVCLQSAFLRQGGVKKA